MNNTQYDKMIEHFKLYQDQWGMTSIVPGEATDNGALFTAETIICILNCGVPNSPFWDTYSKYLAAIDQCIIGYGILQRQPNDPTYNSMDNYTARLALNIILNQHCTGIDKFGSDMRLYDGIVVDGVDTDYPDAGQVGMSKKTYLLAKVLGLGKILHCYNTNNPKKFCFYSWFGRSPAILAMMDIAATGNTTWFREMCLFISQMMGAYQPVDNLDARKLAYVAWQALKSRGPIWRWGYRKWCARLMQDYEFGMETIYLKYFKSEQHPLVQYSKEYIE